ncbi:MAG: GNAT family N-acetyltransferase [Ktedonobacterales bacterium]|nr:GNAT family N-acetyltransferase [Ktedonobacterales bacterium]
MPLIRKAYCYITRRHQGMAQVLVFRHRDYPEAGIQVPKGTIEPGERPATAALREGTEETGLSDLILLGRLARDTHRAADGLVSERHFFHLRAARVPDTWEHTVTGVGDDRGLVFVYWWISAPGEVALVGGHGDYPQRVLTERIEMRFVFDEMTEADARAVMAWRYTGLYAVYNSDGDADALAELLDHRSPHFAARDEQGELVGFFAFGSAAEVGGSDEPHLYTGDGGLSLGLGLRPDRTGNGLGLAYVNAGLAFARTRFTPAYFRLFVLPFNERALHVYERAGFTRVRTITVRGHHGERDFIEMRREVEGSSYNEAVSPP